MAASEVEAAYYGVPPGWIGQRVLVQWNDLHVRCLPRGRGISCGSICARRGAQRRRSVRAGRRRAPTPYSRGVLALAKKHGPA
jgi:hypothetical protein